MDKEKKEKNTKRIKMSRAQRETVIEVLVASLIVGFAAVMSMYLVRYISFNVKVITAKDESLANYESTIINVGICKDSNGDGAISDQELKQCDPNSLSVSQIPGTLRYNVMVNMAQNENLESVAKGALPSSCYENGKKIDYSDKYDSASTDEERTKYLSLMKTCSALRVIPDALPSWENKSATMASLNQVFSLSGLEPDSLSSSTVSDSDEEAATGGVDGTLSMPISWSVETSGSSVNTLLKNLERSIREFNINTLSLEYSGGVLEASAEGEAYYINADALEEKTVTVTEDQKGGK